MKEPFIFEKNFKMINEIPYYIFINGEYLGLFTNIVNLSNKSDPFLPKIKTQVDNLNEGITEANAIYLPQKKSQKTETVVSEDEIRDNFITGFISVVDGNTRHPEKEMAAKAVAIQLCIEKYGSNIIRQSFVNQTNTVNSLVEDLETIENVKDAVAAFGLGIWVTAIKAANDTFNETYLDRTEEIGERIDGPLLPYRLAIQEKWEELEKHIMANQVLTPLPKGETLIKSINTLIDEYTVTAKKRRAGGKNNLPSTEPTNI